MRQVKFVCAGFLAFSLSMVATAASFDCNKARSKVEKSICNDKELGELDAQLALAYKKAMKEHPLPSYVKARQRDWLKLNSFCDPKNFQICLKKNYKERLGHLQPENIIIYSNTRQFSYEGGDAVAEFWQVNPNKWRLSIWGGFAIHSQASQAEGKEIYVGCEFDGGTTDIFNGVATSVGGTSVKYKISDDTFVLGDSAEICAGFGQMPEKLIKVNR